MRRLLIPSLWIVLACVLPTIAFCQVDKTEAALNIEYAGKKFLLRGFPLGPNLLYDATGVPIGGPQVGSWTLAGIGVKHIALDSSGIEIEGERQGLARAGSKLGAVNLGKVRVHVDASGENRQMERLQDILRRVLIDPDSDLRPMAAPIWYYFLSQADRKAREAAWNTDLDTRAIAVKPPLGTTTSAPVATYSPDPAYTPEAKKGRFQGTTVMRVVVDETGVATDIAIVEALGLGLDEEAVAAVRRWRFRPGMRDGKPVQVRIAIEINFRCCP